MIALETWHQWADGLSPEAQANACAVLGMVEGSETARRELDARRPALPTPAFASAVLESISADLVRHRVDAVRWSPPSQALLNLPVAPDVWAAAWPELSAHADGVVRLVLTGLAPGPEADSWTNLLNQAAPAIRAITWRFAPPAAQLVVRWPLRIAILPDNPAGVAVAAVASMQWAAPLLQPTVVARDDTNSDLLVHEGNARDLLAQLEASRLSVKTDLLVVTSNESLDDITLAHLVDLTHASGLVVMPLFARPLRDALDESLYELSHNAQVDVALCAGFARQGTQRSQILLTDALANLRVQALADDINTIVRDRLDPRQSVEQTDGSQRRTRGPVSFGITTPPRLDTGSLVWDHEHNGARTVATTAREVADSLDRQMAESSERRFLQFESFDVLPGGDTNRADKGFIAGRETEVQIHIGPLTGHAAAHDVEFPAWLLPQQRDEWSLTVWLTAPDHLAEPLRQPMLLRHTGASSKAVFRFALEEAGDFEGRISVLHRGRVLQTALLVAGIREAAGPRDPDTAPRFESLVQVRRNLADLERRREFDASFVFNKTTTGVPRMVGLARNHAWITDLDSVKSTVQNIYAALSEVERSVARYANGLGDENGREFLVRIAREGAALYDLLVTRQLKKTARQIDVEQSEYLQVIHTKVSGIVPLEFVYDHVSPARDATVCPQWRDTLKAGSHRCGCDRTDRSHVCPLAFWGVSKVIERHLDAPELSGVGAAYVQSEPVRTSMTLSISGAPLVAWSERVTRPKVKPLIDAITQRFNAAPATPADWKGWVQDVNRVRPKFLLAMPHAEGSGASASLEIGGSVLEAADLTEAHLRLDGGAPPLVALLGCDVSTTADDYAPHVIGFQGKGAAVVISTVATVFGDHAPAAASLLVTQLTRTAGTPRRLGEALRAVKQQALLDNLLMPLCLVAYGDSDWQIAP